MCRRLSENTDSSRASVSGKKRVSLEGTELTSGKPAFKGFSGAEETIERVTELKLLQGGGSAALLSRFET